MYMAQVGDFFFFAVGPRLSSEATGLAANWRGGSSFAPYVTPPSTFLQRSPLLDLMQKLSTLNSPLFWFHTYSAVIISLM